MAAHRLGPMGIGPKGDDFPSQFPVASQDRVSREKVPGRRAACRVQVRGVDLQADPPTDGGLQNAVDKRSVILVTICLLYTSDAADD